MKSLWDLLRPHQWTKNTIAFAGAVFGGRIHEPRSLLLDLCVFGIFCAASSAVYVFNDVVDRERDRRHPKKRLRPIASGKVGVPQAIGLGALLCGVALVGSWSLHPWAFYCVVLYLANGLAYTVFLKHAALVDVISIAFGFILRLLAGIYVLGDLPTSWIVLCTFFMALFLGFAKRRAELASLGEESSTADPKDYQRPVLAKYNVPYLDQLLNSAATMTVICYALFTVASTKSRSLILTLPIVYYGIMHYKRRTLVHSQGEEPDRMLFKDWRFPVCILLWLGTYLLIERWDLRLFR